MYDRNIRVLLIEDNPGDARLLQEYLKEETEPGFTILSFDRLSRGLEYLQDNEVDVLLLDLGLPDSQGLVTFHKLQSAHPGTAIVVLTGLQNDELAVRSVQCGAQDYLVKGQVEPRLLAKVLRYAFERKQAEQTLRSSQEALRSMIDAMEEGAYLVDRQGRALIVNEKIAQRFGERPDELLGKNLYDLDSLETAAARKYWADRAICTNQAVRYEEEREGKFLSNTIYPVQDAKGEVTRLAVIEQDISQRIEAQNILTMERNKARTYLDIVNVILVMLDVDMKIGLINRKGCQMLGYSESELIGLNWTDNFIPERMRESVRAVFEKLIAGDIVGGEYFENPVLIRSGEERIVAWRNTLVKDEAGKISGTLSSGEDITERLLQESELQLQSQIMANMSEGVVLTRARDGVIVYTNPKFDQMFGYGLGELIGLPVSVLNDADDDRSAEEVAEEISSSLNENHFWSGEPRHPKKGGAVFWTSINISTFDHPAYGPVLISVENDITQRLQAEKALEENLKNLGQIVEQRTQELRSAQKRIIRQEKLAFLGQLAGSVGHELRNPLGSISNAVYLLRLILESPPPEVEEALDILQSEVGVAERIISSLLDFARTRAPNLGDVDLSNLLEEVLARENLPQAIQVVWHIQPEFPVVRADAAQLMQVFSNLVRNARQAMPDGGRLEIKVEASDYQWTRISITDTGIGIPEENKKRLFEPLFTTKVKGIGLGLALVRILVEGHGGKIEVESELGRGTTFTVCLPAAGVKVNV
jgi:PAS domain S-box-containing protein